MKALILAAGFGTRLAKANIEPDKPKPLKTVNGRPLIEYVIKSIVDILVIDHIYIVANDRYFDQFDAWAKSQDLPITVFNNGVTCNDERKGSIGDMRESIARMPKDDVLIIGGDNLFTRPLTDIINIFKGQQKPIIAVKQVPKELTKHYGIVERNQSKVITNFVEKPKEGETSSTLASTLLYILPKDTLHLLNEYPGPLDKGGNYIEWLKDQTQVLAIEYEGDWIDIGDPEQLQQAKVLMQ